MDVTRTIEQDVEGRQLVERARDRGVLEHVELARDHPCDAFEGLEQFRFHVRCKNRRAFARHRHRGGMSDALARCGNQCGLARESSAHGLLS